MQGGHQSVRGKIRSEVTIAHGAIGRSGPLDDRDREAVPTLAADRLECGGADPRFRHKHVEQGPDAQHVGVRAPRVNNRSIAHHIITDDDGARPREPQSPFQVARVVWLVCIYEGQIKGSKPISFNAGQRVQRGPHPQINQAREASTLDVRLRDRA